MRRALRHLGVGALVLEAGLAPWLLACGARDARALDASSGLSLDGGARSAEDGAVAALDGGPLVPSFEGQSADGVADASQCFNGVDEDSNGLIDCAESACAATAACCVGSTSAACCAEDVSATLELATCPSGSPAACTTLGARVVSGTPLIAADHSVVPVARTGLDGALDFPQHPLRLRAETVTLEASIRGPESTGQLDATAFGLWAPSLPATSIEPIVAVVVSATRNDVSVVVRNRVVLHTARVAGEHAYTIAVSPSGEATISIDGTELGTVTVPLPDTASLPIVFGRVDNDDAVGGTTRLTSLALRQGACAQLAGLVRGGALLRTDLPGLDEAQTTDPSVVRHGDVVRIAFAALEGSGNTARSLFVGTIEGDTVLEATRFLDVSALRALAPALNATDLAGPELFVHDDVLGAYFAYRTESGWSLGRMDDVTDAASIRAIAIADGTSGGYDDPAYVDATTLLARERDSNRLVQLRLAAPDAVSAQLGTGLCAAESSCDGERSDAFVIAPDARSDAFDHDEVAAPFALAVGPLELVYYAGRRGTRWSLGAMVQGANGYFRTANGGAAILEPSEHGADALGVGAPAAYLDGRELVLVYAGTDGAHWRLLTARMPIRQ